MALPKVTVNVTGSINRPSLDKYGVTGFVFYNDNIADLTGLTALTPIKKFTNLAAVEATGITSTSVNFKDEHYDVEQFFLNGGTEMYIGIFAIPAGTYDFTELDSMMLFSEGDIKIYTVPVRDKALAVADVATLEAIVAAYENEKKTAIALYSANTGAIEIGDLEDLRNLSSDASRVSVVLGQDILNYPLSVTTQNTPGIGAIAGTLAQAKVSENILHIGKYNYAIGTSMNEVGLFLHNGTDANTLIPMTEIDSADQDALYDKGYIFWRYLPNVNGTYLSNDSNCAGISTVFNSIHIVRTRNKAVRELDKGLSLLVGAPVLFNADGTMRQASIKTYENAAGLVLQEMVDAGELSAYSVFVDPSDNVLATKTVTVNASVIPVESSDDVVMNLAFVAELV